MKARLALILAASTFAAISHASAQDREAGWDIGAEVIYQDSSDVSFEGGTRLSFDADWGIALSFGYRFNHRLELGFGIAGRKRTMMPYSNRVSPRICRFRSAAQWKRSRPVYGSTSTSWKVRSRRS